MLGSNECQRSFVYLVVMVNDQSSQPSQLCIDVLVFTYRLEIDWIQMCNGLLTVVVVLFWCCQVSHILFSGLGFGLWVEVHFKKT